MGIIYKITNTINNKEYIGQTTRNIAERWREHKAKSNPSDGTYLHNAIAKYGHENFTIEEIDNCADSLLNDKEAEWIIIADTYYPNGYNLTSGGEGNPKVDHNKILQLWDEGLCLREIASTLNVNILTVGKHLKEYPTYSKQEATYRARKGDFSQPSRQKGINQYTWDGKFVKHYNSAAEVVNGDEYKISHLQYACRGNQVLWNNYQWRYDTEEPPKPLEKPYFSKRRIAQYSLEGELLKIFPSAAAAAREVSPEQNSNVVGNQILQVCKHNRKTAKGYKWEYAEIYE